MQLARQPIMDDIILERMVFGKRNCNNVKLSTGLIARTTGDQGAT